MSMKTELASSSKDSQHKKDIVRLPVIKRRPHLSFSEWQSWNNCQWRWYQDYVEGHRSKAEGIELSFGTVLHSVLEEVLNKDLSKRLSVERAKQLLPLALLWEHASLCLRTKPEYEIQDYIDSGLRLLDCLQHVPEFSEGSVVWNEFELFEKIERTDDIDISFRGFIDIAIKLKAKRGNKSLLFLCDFKSTGRGWFKSRFGDPRTDPLKINQLLFYKHFICKRFSLDPSSVRTTYILMKKKEQKDPSQQIEMFHLSSGPVAMERAISRLQSDITEMYSGTLERNRSKCQVQYGKKLDGSPKIETCPYYNTSLCPAGAEVIINSDVREETESTVHK